MNRMPVVFLPGTLCDERLWQFQVKPLPSTWVVDLRTQKSLTAMLESVRQVPFESFVLVGFSMGGYLAQEFALSYPERVQHLVVVGSSPLGYPPHEKEIVLKSRAFIQSGFFKGITQKRLREFLHPTSYLKNELCELIKSMAGLDAAEVYLRQLEATLDRRDLTQELGRLQCPLTAIVGKQDQIIPPDTVLEFKKWVHLAEVFLLDECGHFCPLEKPDEVNQILLKLSPRS